MVVQRTSPWERPNEWCRRNRKNVVFRKVKSGQVVIYSLQEFSEAVKTFVPAIHAVYLHESENIIEPKRIESSRKIKETLKIRNWNERSTQIVIRTSIFKRLPMMSFHVQWYGGEDDVICGHEKSSDNGYPCPKCNGFYKEDEEWLCCPVCKN